VRAYRVAAAKLLDRLVGKGYLKGVSGSLCCILLLHC